jgi:hypothetical protein
LFVQGISGRCERFAFGFELSFEVRQLLPKRRYILFGLADVLGFLDRATGPSNRGSRPPNVGGANGLPSEKGAEDRRTD